LFRHQIDRLDFGELSAKAADAAWQWNPKQAKNIELLLTEELSHLRIQKSSPEAEGRKTPGYRQGRASEHRHG